MAVQQEKAIVPGKVGRVDLETLNASMPIFTTSARTGEGADGWVDWLRNEIRDFRKEKDNTDPTKLSSS